jgi:hypothetical protein
LFYPFFDAHGRSIGTPVLQNNTASLPSPQLIMWLSTSASTVVLVGLAVGVTAMMYLGLKSKTQEYDCQPCSAETEPRRNPFMC